MSETLPKPRFPTFAAAWRQFWSWLRQLRYTRLRDLLRGRIDGSLDWRAKLRDAGLPSGITDVVQLIAGRRRLWHRERCDIAMELVAHFQDGLDAGESAESLVESFGDVKQAANLMLRAKRRCRPLWWQAWWWASRGFAALVACYALMAVWLAFDRPAVTTDYLAVLNEGIEETPLDDRAWPIYLEVARRNYVEQNGPEGLAESSIEFAWEPDFDEIGEEAARAWIDDHQEVISLIRTAAAKPRLGTPLTADDQTFSDFDPRTGELTRSTREAYIEHDLISTLLGHIQTMRSYARVLRRDALIAARDGDAQRALADLEAMLGISDHADQHPFIFSGLVAIAIDGIAYQLANELLRESPDLFTDEHLRRLAHRVATIDYRVPAWLEGERMMFLDVVQRLYTDDGNGDGHFTNAGLAYMNERLAIAVETLDGSVKSRATEKAMSYAIGPAVYFAFASRKETIEKYDSVVGPMPILLARPLWETTYEQWSTDQISEPSSLYQQLHYMPVELLAPAIQSAASAVERARGLREGWLIGIALELSRRENGEYPASLDELSPRWLPELPVDRINGTPLVYKLVDGKPIVYSLGVDADDDGGRPSEDYQEAPWAHPVGPPRPNARDTTGKHPDDGDWVIWSLAEPRPQAGPE